MKRNRALLPLSLLLSLLLPLLLCACGNTKAGSSQYRIYLITKSTSTEFWRSVFAGANAARAEYNVDLIIRGPVPKNFFLFCIFTFTPALA